MSQFGSQKSEPEIKTYLQVVYCESNAVRQEQGDRESDTIKEQVKYQGVC